MSKKPKIVSAGGVVLREHTAGLQVLLIHRERYDDWSLPKGKGEADELLPETAVREIREETGVAALRGPVYAGTHSDRVSATRLFAWFRLSSWRSSRGSPPPWAACSP